MPQRLHEKKRITATCNTIIDRTKITRKKMEEKQLYGHFKRQTTSLRLTMLKQEQRRRKNIVDGDYVVTETKNQSCNN